MRILHGIDMTNLSRSEYDEPNFEKKILSKKELKEFNELKGDKKIYLAKRWAMKEAIIKASQELTPLTKIDIYKENLVYKCLISNKEFIISTSREGNFIIASAISIS